MKRVLSKLAGRGMVLAMALCAPLVSGCTSIDVPRWLQVKRLFVHEDPLVILRDSTDGAKRAEALSKLREPVRHGGSAEEQELYVRLLTTAASATKRGPHGELEPQGERDPLARLAAIQMLGSYKDPRAVMCLEKVCQQHPGFSPEINSLIRQRALDALAETGDPSARKMLLVVARGADSPLESSLTDRQQTLDERLAAVRGLGKFNQYDSIETLVHILETERDAALRARSYQSLREATGKDLGTDPVAWREMLRSPGDPALAREPTFIERVMGIGQK